MKGKMMINKKLIKLVLILTSPIFISSCIASKPKVSITLFNHEQLQPTKRIEIYTNRSKIKQNYKELGIITVKGGEEDFYDGTFVEVMVEKAKAIGAHALILIPSDNQKRSLRTGGIISSGNRKKAQSVAIFYTD
ncbi:MAG: hypothetical protein KAI96_01225 [Thermodesulfovibrionia bacterium]|nr:hypothetical protein [Thermodesulfovibrionia bacterium]